MSGFRNERKADVRSGKCARGANEIDARFLLLGLCPFDAFFGRLVQRFDASGEEPADNEADNAHAKHHVNRRQVASESIEYEGHANDGDGVANGNKERGEAEHADIVVMSGHGGHHHAGGTVGGCRCCKTENDGCEVSHEIVSSRCIDHDDQADDCEAENGNKRRANAEIVGDDAGNDFVDGNAEIINAEHGGDGYGIKAIGSHNVGERLRNGIEDEADKESADKGKYDLLVLQAFRKNRHDGNALLFIVTLIERDARNIPDHLLDALRLASYEKDANSAKDKHDGGEHIVARLPAIPVNDEPGEVRPKRGRDICAKANDASHERFVFRKPCVGDGGEYRDERKAVAKAEKQIGDPDEGHVDGICEQDESESVSDHCKKKNSSRSDFPLKETVEKASDGRHDAERANRSHVFRCAYTKARHVFRVVNGMRAACNAECAENANEKTQIANPTVIEFTFGCH